MYTKSLILATIGMIAAQTEAIHLTQDANDAVDAILGSSSTSSSSTTTTSTTTTSTQTDAASSGADAGADAGAALENCECLDNNG